MNQNKDYEFVSAAMDDDDLSEEALDKLLSDSEARQRWREYHLIRDCMQRTKPVAQESVPAAARVAVTRQLEQEADYTRRPAANHAFKGFAVAASILAVAVGVWQFWPQTGVSQGAAVAQQAVPEQTGKAEIVSVGGNATVKNDAVANAEAQGAVVPNAARSAAEHPSDTVEKQTAVRVEKLPEGGAASNAR